MKIKALKENAKFLQFFYVSHLAAPRRNLDHIQGGRLTYLMLIIMVFQVRR